MGLGRCAGYVQAAGCRVRAGQRRVRPGMQLLRPTLGSAARSRSVNCFRSDTCCSRAKTLACT